MKVRWYAGLSRDQAAKFMGRQLLRLFDVVTSRVDAP